jgi:hypothetical protein
MTHYMTHLLINTSLQIDLNQFVSLVLESNRILQIKLSKQVAN